MGIVDRFVYYLSLGIIVLGIFFVTYLVIYAIFILPFMTAQALGIPTLITLSFSPMIVVLLGFLFDLALKIRGETKNEQSE